MFVKTRLNIAYIVRSSEAEQTMNPLKNTNFFD